MTEHCNYWGPGFVCDKPLETEQELADGCCSSCALKIEAAAARAEKSAGTYPAEVEPPYCATRWD